MHLSFYHLIFTFGLTLGLTIVFSFAPEKYLKPSPSKIANSCIILQGIIVTFLFIAVTLIVQRLVFASLAVSIFLIILSGVSNAKHQALREPLVFSDIAMFSQAFKYPRLYFPFLGLLPVIIMPLVIIGLISILLILEPAMAFTWQRIFISLITLALLFVIAKKMAENLTLSEEPEIDNQQYGLLNSLFAYAVQANSDKHKEHIKRSLSESPFVLNDNAQAKREMTVLLSDVGTPPSFSEDQSKQKPQNITVIQSESFFDARRLDDSINTDVLHHYDNCLQESIQYGKLDVPAWGANTMRTEFSFLTGLKYENMGLYRYYPYQYLHKLPVVSLAKLLQSQGYHCVCIHPHPASFFGRDRIFPKMGFDDFIDIGSFSSGNKDQFFGPYISDQAITDKILEVTENHNRANADQPLFIFAITMENHGPLHLEKTTKIEQEQYFSNTPIDKINDLTVYLRHLKNADKMIHQLTSAYLQSTKETTLCFYGDHIPSIPKIYQELAYEDKDSDYFIWNTQAAKDSNKAVSKAKKENIKVDSLAQVLLKGTGNIKP